MGRVMTEGFFAWLCRAYLKDSRKGFHFVMKIHINRKGQKMGPFPLDQVNLHLENGSLLPNDSAWHDGMADWVLLSDVIGVIIPSKDVPPPLSTPIESPVSVCSWEYDKTSIEGDVDEVEHMDDKGEDGWELVCVTHQKSLIMGVPLESYFWKRPIKDE